MTLDCIRPDLEPAFGIKNGRNGRWRQKTERFIQDEPNSLPRSHSVAHDDSAATVLVWSLSLPTTWTQGHLFKALRSSASSSTLKSLKKMIFWLETIFLFAGTSIPGRGISSLFFCPLRCANRLIVHWEIDRCCLRLIALSESNCYSNYFRFDSCAILINVYLGLLPITTTSYQSGRKLQTKFCNSDFRATWIVWYF